MPLSLPQPFPLSSEIDSFINDFSDFSEIIEILAKVVQNRFNVIFDCSFLQVFILCDDLVILLIALIRPREHHIVIDDDKEPQKVNAQSILTT